MVASLLYDVNQSRRDWRVIVKVIRKWEEPLFDGVIQTHLILADKNGYKVEAVIPSFLGELISKFNEGSWKYVENFFVLEIPGIRRYTVAEKRLLLDHQTQIQNCEMIKEDPFFDFVNIRDIINHRFDENITVDVIGAPMWVGKLVTFGNISLLPHADPALNTIKFQLREKDKTYVNCMAMGRVADEIDSMWNSVGNHSSVICLRFWRVATIGDYVVLRDAGDISQVFFDPNIEETPLMKEWIQFTRVNDACFHP